ncbi:MAG: hypothetical protein V3W44_04365 [Dehalococcoidales bacterium]
MLDIKTTEIGRTFSYMELIQATDAVWGGVAWPGPEKQGCVVVLGAGKVRYDDGWQLSVLDEYHSFDVREMVRNILAMDLKYWLTRPRVDQSGSPCGRWIGDETHDAADTFLAESTYERAPGDRGQLRPRTLRLTSTALIEMDHLYDLLMPKIKAWHSKGHELLYLKKGWVALCLNEFTQENVERQEAPSVGSWPAVEALGYAAVEMQRWLEQRFTTRVHRGYSKADRGAPRLLGSY